MPRSPSKIGAKRQEAEKAGRRAEALAALYLRAKLFSIIATRVKTPVGEIDIVAQRGRLIVFVEVKQRSSADALALEAVNQTRITRAAEWFMMKRPQFSGFDCRFDVIVLAKGRWPHHLQNAFPAA